MEKSESDALAAEVFDSWLGRFGSALEARDIDAVARCFETESYWKDILSFTWGFRTFEGVDEIADALRRVVDEVEPRLVRAAGDRTPPRLVKRSGKAVVESCFNFDTYVGVGTGFARILLDHGAPQASNAWIVLTTLEELRGFEERTGSNRPTGHENATGFSGDNWLDKRLTSQAYTDRDPEVLIIGGGQSGLTLGARLRVLGVDALIVEKWPAIGDEWRNRYHSLTLHNEVWANSMPYMPFPPTWPTFVAKDQLAGWLEAYAEAMELNVWTDTEFLGADYDESAAVWKARLRRAGQEREVQAQHLVLATGGVSGVPNMAELPGLGDFSGEVAHSSRFSNGARYADKRAIVVGTGNSGHDVAQELHSYGAERVTMIQRDPTTVVSLEPSGVMVYALYSEGPPVEEIDLITTSIPYPVLRDTYQWLTERTNDLDRDLLDGLETAGFRTDGGSDGTGFHMKYLRSGGGYYINVGCSELIIAGEIDVAQAADIDTFTTGGLRMADGSVVEADVVVLATGYKNLQEGIRRLLGDTVADRVGPVWGFDENYAPQNMYQRTGQPGFWVMGGSLVETRPYSKHLALQIRAELSGLMPLEPLIESRPSRTSR